MDLEERFSRIISSNAWGSKETPCGPGSTLEACAEIIHRLPAWISSYQVKSIVDLGCGDFHWMKEVDLSGIEYDGYDIVCASVEAAQQHSSPNIRFHHTDILAIEIPKADLILCKDVLIHLPDQEALALLHSITESGSRLLASTTAPGWPNLFRGGMQVGEFSPIDIEQAPYNLGVPIDSIEVPHKEGNPRKYLALWGLKGILDLERRSL
jgi:SAM-dependent methyltransferase